MKYYEFDDLLSIEYANDVEIFDCNQIPKEKLKDYIQLKFDHCETLKTIINVPNQITKLQFCNNI